MLGRNREPEPMTADRPVADRLQEKMRVARDDIQGMYRPVADREPLSAEEEAMHRRVHDYPRHLTEDIDCTVCRLLATLDAARAHPDEAGLREAAWQRVNADILAVIGDRATRNAVSDLLNHHRSALVQSAVPVAGAEEGERLATLVVQAFTEYATEGERAQAAGWRFLTAAYDIAQHRAPALRAALATTQPERRDP